MNDVVLYVYWVCFVLLPLQIANRKVDLAIDTPVIVWFARAGDYASYSYYITYCLAVPRPLRLPPTWNILYPLTDAVWVWLGTAVLALMGTFGLMAAVAGDGFRATMGAVFNTCGLF